MHNLAGLVLENLDRDPDAVALGEPDGRVLRRGELRQRVDAVAEALVGAGFAAGDRAVVQIPPGAELLATTLAVIALGGVPVLLEGGLGDAVYLSRITAAAPRWLIVHPLLKHVGSIGLLRGVAGRLGLPPVPPTDKVLTVSRGRVDQRLRQGAPPRLTLTPREPEDAAIVVYTGGTTSAPKGVQHTHKSLRGFMESVRGLFLMEGFERLVVDTLPQALYGIYLGLEAHLAHGRGPRRADRVEALLRSGRAQGYFGAPYLWREIMRRSTAGPLPDTVRCVVLGSAPVRPRFLQALQGFLAPSTQVTSLYGMTEAGPICTASLGEKLAWTGPGDLVGRPVPGVVLTLDVPEGEVGEVLLDGPSVTPGYLGQPPRAGPLRTGDLGQLVPTPTGPVLTLHGRRKEMIIRRGVNLYPGTLEGPILAESLRRGLAVEDCALLGDWDEHSQDERLALIVAGPPTLDLTAVAAAARAAAGPDGAPDEVLRIDSFPVKGRQNKRDLAALKALLTARHAPPRSRRVEDVVLPFGAAQLVRRVQDRFTERPLRALGELALRLGLWFISQATWALDELVAPRWREAQGRGPLFIIGHQRSGTTALHRLLAADTAHARALTLGEMLFPAVSAAPLRAAVAGLDRALGGALSRLEDRIFGPIDALHRLRLGEVEEDEFVLWAVFASIMCANDHPLSVERRQLDTLRHFDQQPAARQARVLGFYRDVLTRRLHRDVGTAATERWIVAKNPAFTQKIPALARLFPDARFIYLVRDPLKAIPSRLALLRAIWRLRAPEVPSLTPAQVDVIVEDSVRTYLCAERDLPGLPEHRRLVVRHDALHADPNATIERIYAHFELPGPPPQATVQAPPPRVVDLQGLSLDEERLRRVLAPVFERYGF
ncbi:MAG: AMP-binding protein [Deltaproteobacteria bacterium]|nr:AMP-binding protein [Deltaproteobacteria bacterium]